MKNNYFIIIICILIYFLTEYCCIFAGIGASLEKTIISGRNIARKHIAWRKTFLSRHVSVACVYQCIVCVCYTESAEPVISRNP